MDGISVYAENITTGKILIAAVLAFSTTFLVMNWKEVKKFLGFTGKKGASFQATTVGSVTERCKELFPMDTMNFRGQVFQRGMKVRVVTIKDKIIEGEFIGKSDAELICIRMDNKLLAQQVEKIKSITVIKG